MTTINEKLTWNEIVEKYPDKWVALKDIEWKDESNVGFKWGGGGSSF